jgi:hypothetical protein
VPLVPSVVVNENHLYLWERNLEMTNNTKSRRRLRVAAASVTAVAAVGATAAASVAVIAPGTGKAQVQHGLDNDNADNEFIQPAGVTAKQHMDNTDVLFGRGGGDLQIGNLGGDTLVSGPGADIQVGGPERGQAPNSDVIIAGPGHDVNIWAPGDGSDAYIGEQGSDDMVFAPFVTKPNGDLLLERWGNRRIPRVDIDGSPQFSCTIVPVPKSEQLGAQFLVRFNVNDVPAVTVRQKDVERVFCPSPHNGRVLVADLTDRHPAFKSVRLNRVKGLTGAIIAPVA